MPELEAERWSGEERDAAVAFTAFVLAHAACGDDVLEVRLGEWCLLEWCTTCAVMRTFFLPVRQ